MMAWRTRHGSAGGHAGGAHTYTHSGLTGLRHARAPLTSPFPDSRLEEPVTARRLHSHRQGEGRLQTPNTEWTVHRPISCEIREESETGNYTSSRLS